MLSFNPEKKNCTGCSACYAACPLHCISMQEDQEGFLYPMADENCIDCGLCEKICPIKKDFCVSVKQRAFAAVSKDDSIWRRSASGGAFSEICKVWGDNKTLIVGAAWNNFSVHHIGIIGVDNIQPLCRSKYIASALEDTFQQIKEHLRYEKVIFCGTPCQVSGLKSFLRKDYSNLLTIDLICHGVGSPSVFQSCIDAMNKTSGKKILGYEFRAKREIYEIDHLSLLKFKNSQEYIERDPYTQLFLQQLCLRPSCGENCLYRDKQKRPGDITIADFKGLTKVLPQLRGSYRNYSTIVLNTQKGLDVLNGLHSFMEMHEVSIEDIIRFNPLFDHHTWFSQKRELFFKDFTENASKSIQKWTTPYRTYKRSLKAKLYDYAPMFIRKIVDILLQR